MKKTLTLTFSKLQNISSWFDLKHFQSPAIRKSLIALAVLILLLDAGLVVRTVMLNDYWKTTTDFGVYQNAAEKIRLGSNPYEIPSQFINQTDPNVTIPDPYSYPPLFAELLIPLFLLGDTVARYLWIFLSYAFLAASLIVLLRGFGKATPWFWVLVIITIVTSANITRNDLYHGQANFLILFLLVSGLWMYTKNRPILAGMLLGVVFVIKPFLGIIALYFLWRKAWKTSLTSLITGGSVLALSFVPLLSNGFGAVTVWGKILEFYASPQYSARSDNLSLHGLLLRLFSPNPFTRPWTDSVIASQLLHLLLIGLLLLTFALVIPSKRLIPDARQKNKALLLTEIGLLYGLFMSYGPLTEGDHLFALLIGLVGVVLMLQQHQAEGTSSVKYWKWVTWAWGIFFAIQANPVRFNPVLPRNLEWVRIEGPLILLTGLTGFILLGIAILLAYALYKEKAETTVPSPGS